MACATRSGKQRLKRAFCLLILSLVGAMPALSAQEPQISGQLNASRIFVGESVVYSIMVSNVEDPPEPDLSSFDDFDVEFLGQQSQNSRSVVIINGVRKDTNKFGKLFQYSLTPSRVGTLTVPAPKVLIDGEELLGEPLTLVVCGASEQETVFLKTLVEPAEVYPTQKFTVTLQIDVRRLPGTFQDRSPLSIQDPVKLNIPWLSEDSIPNCTPQTEPQKVLEPMLAQRGQQDGFAINGFSVSARSFFGRSRAAQFIPPSQNVTLKLKDGTDADFIRYSIKQTFVAERSGEVKISPATIKGLFAVPEVLPIEGDELFAVSDSPTLKVLDVPTEGRPRTFCGGIGQFEVAATVAPANVNVGDPMTLTLNVFGEGTLDLIVPPDLKNVEGFKDKFRLYEPTSRSVDNGRIFTFTLRPETDDIQEVAEIPISYFDVEQGEYVTVKTDAIPLTVTKREALQVEDIVSETGNQSTEQEASVLQQNKAGLAANHSTMSPPTSSLLTWKQWCLLWGLVVAATGCTRLLVTAGQNRNSDPIALRRRQAFTNAKAALKTAEATASGSGKVPADSLSKLLIALVADSTGQQTSGMTSSETVATLAGLGISPEIQQQTTSFLNDCDAARYGASNDDQTSLLSRCSELVATLTKELRK